MERTTGDEGKASQSESEAKARDQHAPAADDIHRTPKKRRKVNHGVVCCEQERPCTRCIKRNIGHLCHDEPRDHEPRKSKSLAPSTVQETESQPDLGLSSNLGQNAPAMRPPSFDSAMGNGPAQAAKAAFDTATLASRSNNALQLVQPTPVSGIAASALGGMSPFTGFSDAWLASQNPYHDMHNFHPNYVVAPEVTNEFNLLNDFLQTSLLDDGALLGDDQTTQADSASGFPNSSSAMLPPSAIQGGSMPAPPNVEQGKAIPRPASAIPTDKTRAYYLQAADPSGNAAPEERMTQVLHAKYEAGLLKPFNYIKGYTRLQNYLDTHVAPSSKQKIIRQLDRFRPKFREKIKDLTDMHLVLVEMWFERTLMDYDRVFASMAVPACCWRRTGEIFRGNKEMAELIKVPVEDLRGGKIALHEILTEESNVRYWEEFGTIAFDSAHDTLFTACSLKSPIDGVKHVVNCCFSFRIRRDDHKIPKFATHLKKKLLLATQTKDSPDSDTPPPLPLPLSLIEDIARHVDKIHACQQTYVPGLSGDPEIDGLATGLWNVCTRLGREVKEKEKVVVEGGALEQRQRQQQQQQQPLEGGGRQRLGSGGGDGQRKKAGTLYLSGRVLAFYLLGVARPRENGRVEVVVRLMRLGLKVLRDCIVKLAGLVVQTTADYKGWLQNMVKGLPEEECWVENRLDVAEHMYTKAEKLHQFLTPEYAERLADVLYEIGKSLSAQSDFAIAIKWFERANEVINGQGLEQLSREGLELRLAILQALVTALLGTGTPEGLDKAKNYVDFIEAEAGNKFVVSLLKLELLQKAPAEVFDSEAYADVLRHIIRNFTHSDSGFKLIMHHIRKLHDKSPGAGCSVLDDFIVALSGAEKDGWMEKAVVTRMWMITNQRDSVETIKAAQGVLGHLPKPLSAEAALLWKKLESNYSQGQYDLAESWCQLSLHSVFQDCGAGNTAKLESLDAATSIIHKMSQQSWKEPMTAYLAFKVAIRVEDRGLAERCLQTVGQAPDHVDYLGACIAESQKAGDIMCAIVALKKLQEKYEYKEPNSIHLPALFRCTIRLWNLLADSPGADTKSIVDDLCGEFEAGIAMADSLLRAHAPGQVLYSTMRKIVNEIWVLESFDAIKLAKYTRCLFQATLPLDDGLAMRLLDEACGKARELRESQAAWPEEELEWMATTSFNHAIDCYSAQEIERAKEWATKAINLAHYCHDGGLEEILQNKYLRLSFDGGSL
ncbi:meiosis protein SPO22/ZIP4 like-domain-containing protein [Chaetomidium leptoderma]|uniref:Meiosis protein SPO22/ZIP4 like-domain-containing protein n=1 Tax=Chaetomidium leptoderma TaxID=669021 RepID=A0AAN6VW83_9PEZI|nr:meiosis protein SPO22/ZIP4 like-domain-containing protein [Chaetomidium leptoderma]